MYKRQFEDKPKLEWRAAVIVLGASTALCVTGAACTLASTTERFRSTFYKHYTMAMYIRGYMWHERTLCRIDGEMVECDREFIRAFALSDTARTYWPMDLVEPWARQNWSVIAPRICRD